MNCFSAVNLKCWKPTQNDANQWLQVDFGEYRKVKARTFCSFAGCTGCSMTCAFVNRSKNFYINCFNFLRVNIVKLIAVECVFCTKAPDEVIQKFWIIVSNIAS